MRLLHVSDTHGEFPELHDLDTVDAVVHSGDFCPNRFRERMLDAVYQQEWLASVMPNVRAWLRGKPFLFVGGNHDFYGDVVGEMLLGGIQATSIDRELVRFRKGGYGSPELRFMGFPFVRYWSGAWNHELSEIDLARNYNSFLGPYLEGEAGPIDVVVSHTPMYGVLDRVGEERTGSHALRRVLQDCKHMPKALLVGHIHECGGRKLAWSRGLLVSNAARSQRILEVQES